MADHEVTLDKREVSRSTFFFANDITDKSVMNFIKHVKDDEINDKETCLTNIHVANNFIEHFWSENEK